MPRSAKQLTREPIGIVYLGGTFGSYGQPLASLAPDTFLPILQNILAAHFASYPNHTDAPVPWQILPNAVVKDSSQLTPMDIAAVYSLLIHARMGNIRRFVILTGTDTLAYLAALLAEAFAESDTCVVVTGAMQPLLDTQILTDYVINPDSDACQNLFDACQLACHGEAGVRVCFAGEHWPAQTVQKIHSHDLMAFVGHHRAGYPANSFSKKISPRQRALWLEDKIAQLPMVCQRMAVAKIVTVYAVPMAADAWQGYFAALIQQAPDGLILLGFGAGNFLQSPEVENALKQLKAQGCLVVASTQCPYGGADSTYAAGAWLAECGVLSSGRLTVAAIYARLLWLTAQYDTPSRRRQRWRHCMKDTHSVA
ncbi:L-asparaginase 1 [Moraxella atlantae]|uniref:L-asparaginase 1 n=1 Tax=Faucicola atlantae TaxID=34059 RepID=A0A1B8Q9R2_9GAMM|nr:asparaginase domain-containing protein [Moraxella atlantae]OBX75847.1 L-asparaginase 1 [Moraxella atlantae]